MNNNVSVISLIALCLLSLIVGIFNGMPSYKNYPESQVKKKMSKLLTISSNKVALITIDGIIDSNEKANAFSNEFNAQAALKALQQAGEDENIKGIIIKMNTPGGTVGMSQNIYNEVIRIRKIKPVVVSMQDLAASGGYYIASGADRIIALGGTLTGSIGVIFSTMDVHELLADKLSVYPNVIKSGKHKDIGSAYRRMTPEDRTLLSNIVQDSYSQFLSAIKNGRIDRNDTYTAQKRNIDFNVLKKYADGRIFTGNQAYKLGLVDQIGDMYVAQDVINSMINQKNKTHAEIELVPYSKMNSLNEILFGASEALFNKNTSVMNSLIPTSIKYSKTPLYLWE